MAASTADPPAFNLFLPITEHGPASAATAVVRYSAYKGFSSEGVLSSAVEQVWGNPKYSPRNNTSPITKPLPSPMAKYSARFL